MVRLANHANKIAKIPTLKLDPYYSMNHRVSYKLLRKICFQTVYELIKHIAMTKFGGFRRFDSKTIVVVNSFKYSLHAV